MCSGAEEERGDSGEAVADSEYRLAMGNMVTEPAARVGGAGVEDVVQRVEADGEACGAGHAVSRREHSRSGGHQQRVREIPTAENPDTHKQATERWRQPRRPRQTKTAG